MAVSWTYILDRNRSNTTYRRFCEGVAVGPLEIYAEVLVIEIAEYVQS